MKKRLIYTMSQIMWDTIRYPLVWDYKQKKMVKKGKPLSKKEALKVINDTFGLMGTVVEVNII